MCAADNQYTDPYVGHTVGMDPIPMVTVLVSSTGVDVTGFIWGKNVATNVRTAPKLKIIFLTY